MHTSGEVLKFEDYVEEFRRPPVRGIWRNQILPLVGLVEILAVSRLVADTDCLGGSYKNAGFIEPRQDADGTWGPIQVINLSAKPTFFFRVHFVDNELKRTIL